MNFSSLYNLNLFPIGIKDYLFNPDGEVYMVYAPLAKAFVLIDETSMINIVESSHHKKANQQHHLLQKLVDLNRYEPQAVALNPGETFALTFLPNNVCNLSCSYCYASKSHGNTRLDKNSIKQYLDFFIDPNRISRKDLYISFGGGGEPFLSWSLVEFAIIYASELGNKYGFNINFSFASNGTIVTPAIIQILKKYKIKSNISFDILERIQNKERGKYKQVAANLETLLDEDIIPTINSVITPNNQHLQLEMVNEIAERFPKIRRLSFDSLVDANYFSTTKEIKEFYKSYTQNFFEARKFGKTKGITVSCIKHHNLEIIKDRACVGGFDVTPDGEISMCFFVSSPNEKLYKDFIYGGINKQSGEIKFDKDKYEDLMKYDSEYNNKCKGCLAKWHCGGGCLYQIKSYSSEMMNEICEFVQSFSIKALMEYIDDSLLQEVKSEGMSMIVKVFRK